MKTFKFIGVSNKNGVVKPRLTNREGYGEILVKEGHTGVVFVELEEPQTREAALALAIDMPEFAVEAAQAALRPAPKAVAEPKAEADPAAPGFVKAGRGRPRKVKPEAEVAAPVEPAEVLSAEEAELEDLPF